MIAGETASQAAPSRKGAALDAFPQDIVRSIATHAKRTPDAVAIAADGVRLTYANLESRASQVASRLRAEGIPPGAHVAICLQRPTEMLAAFIGILKCGSVCVPLDCGDPSPRTRAMLEAGALQSIVSEQAFADSEAAGFAHCIRMDQIEAPAVPESPIADYDSDGPACVLYRADRGGGFIGVTLKRRALSARSFGEEVDILASDRIVQPVTFAHDVVGFEMLHAVSSGATVICVPLFPFPAPGTLASMLDNNAATRVFLPAKVLDRLAHDFPSSLMTLRTIIVDEPDLAWKTRWRNLPPHLQRRIYGAYGRAQTGGCCMLYSIAEPRTYVASGFTLRLLNERLEEVLKDVPGEICIGTATSNDVNADASGKTSASTCSGSRPQLDTGGCHTGDYARCTSDGSIEFVGRRDRQLTMNGLRIEPQEIEAILRQQPGVLEATVSLRAGQAQRTEKSIVAFVSTVPGEFIAAADLQRSLKNSLPAAMIPSVLISPKSVMEEILLDIWREVLKTDQIGTSDNFLDVGGHSMALIKVAALIQKRLGRKLSVVKLLANPTIRALAKELSDGSAVANPAV